MDALQESIQLQSAPPLLRKLSLEDGAVTSVDSSHIQASVAEAEGITIYGIVFLNGRALGFEIHSKLVFLTVSEYLLQWNLLINKIALLATNLQVPGEDLC